MVDYFFDTHKFIKAITEAGMPLEQAEVLAAGYLEMSHNRLATKDDLKDIEYRMVKKFNDIEKKMDNRFDDLEKKLKI